MPILKLNDIELYYETYGNGQPLILISGMISDSQSWVSLIKNLSKNHFLIIPDNRGVGRTKPQDADITIQKMSDDYYSLIKHLDLKSVSLLGHSMGGFVALDFAIRYPEYTSKLILASTSAFNSKRNIDLNRQFVSDLESGMEDDKWFRNIFYWLFSNRIFNNKIIMNDLIQLSIESPYRQSNAAFTNQTKAIENFNCLKNLPDIKSETMIVFGKEDKLFPPEKNIEMLKAIPNNQVTIIENAAHTIHFENSKDFINCILNFLEE